MIGGSFDESLVEEGDYTQDSGERAMTKLLGRRPELDAVFVASDVMAVGALNALRRAGRGVPEDVAIGGFDDSSAAVAARPALTTIRQPYPRISSEMVRLLLSAIDGGEPSAVILPTEWCGGKAPTRSPTAGRKPLSFGKCHRYPLQW